MTENFTASISSERELTGTIKDLSIYHTDAYQIAVRNGFKGTIEEWLESLKGKPGYTPQKGIDYFDGKDGDAYVITNEDREEIERNVLLSIPTDFVINWDFVPTDRETCTHNGITFYRACDLPCSFDELSQAILYVAAGEKREEYYLGKNNGVLVKVDDNTYVIQYPLLPGITLELGVVILNDTSENKRGIYASKSIGSASVYLVIPRSTVMSWGRLFDKPFYEYIGEPTEILSTTTVELTHDGDKWVGYIEKSDAALVTDRLYAVAYDGTEYKCVTQYLGNNVYEIGDATIDGGKSNGEPFTIKYDHIYGKGRYTVYDYSDSTASNTHTISIAESNYSVKKIDKKFLPEGNVTSINGANPDENGNVSIDFGGVKSVNGKSPDASGNVDLGSLEADWNTLKNKPFYTEEGMVDVFSETDVPITDYGYMKGWQQEYSNGTNLNEGETYHVVWGDVDYELTAIPVLIDSTAPSYICLGNTSIAGVGDDTGEPFLFANQYADTSGLYMVATSETITSKKVRVYQIGEVVHPLEAKYLPKDDIIAMIDAYIGNVLGGKY